MNVDVIVIGSGQAGVPLAARLAESGRKVILAERASLGGTCVNTGCTPTKTMVASARAAHVARQADRLGVTVGDVTVDLGAVVDRKEAIVAQWRAGVEKRLARAGENLTLVRGHARFVGPREIDVAGERHAAGVVVINVGGRPASPPVPGLDGVPWLDNAGLMSLRKIPTHLLVLGGGYIGCELGQMFARFGSEVTMVDVADHLMAREDPEISTALEDALREEGIRLQLGAQVESAAASDDGVTLRLKNDAPLTGSHLLVATGRRPNTDDLSCDAAGVRLDRRGFVEVDDHYRTTAEGVYAVGDAIDQPQFTHTSWDDHRILFDLLAGHSKRGRGGRLIPYVAFTDPQVAGVGMNEREARAAGVEYEVATMPFGHVARAIELDERAGTMKVLLDPKTERVRGAFIVGIEAGELIHIFVALMQAGAPARALVDAQMAHPTLAEGVQSLVMRLARYKI